MRTNWFRHPKGHKQAKVNQARPEAIPPTSWDDSPLDNKAAFQYAKKLKNKVNTYSTFRGKFKAKFPRWNDAEIHWLFYFYR